MLEGLGELTNLQTINQFVLEKNKGCELKELGGLIKLKGILSIQGLKFCTSIDGETKGKFLQLTSGLQELKLDWWKQGAHNELTSFELDDVIYESVLDCLQPHSNLQKISIHNYGGLKLQHLPRFDQFPSLKHLELDYLPNVEYIIDVNNDDYVSSSTFFPSLEELRISKMPKLVRWCKGTTPIIFPYPFELTINDSSPLHVLKSFHAPNLKALRIGLSDDELDVVPWKDYENLTSLHLVFVSNLEYLPECWQHYMKPLQHLSLDSCENLKSLPEWIGNLTSLTELYIRNCEKLTSLPHGIGNLNSLTRLGIDSCRNLASLPEGIRHIPNLKCLDIVECPILEKSCKEDTGEDWPKIAHIPDLRIYYTHY
ncbi:disease resistance protein RGA2-like [Benincasa hispida]|uniref:disease resistance protein RGA2-like n=1 Tax=Benincasa hispida TaxID=102211 RepID=UPI0019002E3A|nr:disease resistance protein RGA2-like [Benincasa hispida]